MKKYFFANWKMYLDFNESLALAQSYAENFFDLPEDVVMSVFPSSLSLAAVGDTLAQAGVSYGPQNLYWVEKGGYTGEVSANMYKAVGCEYTLVGHSERRHLFGETNDDVKNKITAALAAGLTPVLCVGETQAQREKGDQDLVVKEQLDQALKDQNFSENKLIVAYEPVWAIGTGENCSAVSAEHMAEKIKTWVKELLPNLDTPVLYGGSVRAENVSEYLKQNNIAGVLVGGASAKITDWQGIVKNSV